MSRVEKRLLREMGRAICDYNLLAPDDRVMVAVSGGKDSLSLLALLGKLAASWPVRFSVVAVNVDQGQPGFPAHVLEAHFRAAGVEYRMVHQDTYSVVQRLTPPGKTYCAVCSRMRRGILYRVAGELGCTKIALGHHREDLVETLLMSACFSGALRSMPARLRSDDGRHTIIRPLVYCAEDWLKEYAAEQAFPVIPCNLCGSQENLQRKRIKALVASLAADHPAVPGNLLHALQNVVPSHLLDPRLHGADAVDAGEEDGAPAEALLQVGRAPTPE